VNTYRGCSSWTRGCGPSSLARSVSPGRTSRCRWPGCVCITSTCMPLPRFFYGDAFAVRPELANDLAPGKPLRRGPRGRAGRGTGQGEDNSPLSNLDRQTWRERARNWLKENLADLAKLAASDKVAARQAAPLRLAPLETRAGPPSRPQQGGVGKAGGRRAGGVAEVLGRGGRRVATDAAEEIGIFRAGSVSDGPRGPSLTLPARKMPTRARD